MYKDNSSDNSSGNRPPSTHDKQQSVIALAFETAIEQGTVRFPPVSRKRAIAFRSTINRYRKRERDRGNPRTELWDMVTNGLEQTPEIAQSGEPLYQIVMKYEKDFWSQVEQGLGLGLGQEQGLGLKPTQEPQAASQPKTASAEKQKSIQDVLREAGYGPQSDGKSPNSNG